MTMSVLETRIRERAYELWEREGRPDGREAQHWEQAAREILATGDAVIAAKAATVGKQARAGKTAAKGRARRAA